MKQVQDGRIVRMRPLDEVRSPSRAEAELTREYLRWCERAQGGGDCLRLLVDGPTLRGEDRYALAMAIALGSVLGETRQALREMVDPATVLAMVVVTAAIYFGLWLLPEPVSKAVAAALTVGLMAWLGVDTLWGLIGGWSRLVDEADRATTFEQLSKAGETYGRVMGENSARILVMLVTAALGGGTAKLGEKLTKLPGYSHAVVQAEAQGGIRMAAVAEVESVALSSEGSFSVLTRNPGSPASAAPAGTGSAASAVIRHQGGNRQVVLNGQRWHVPANKSVQDIPATDPVGDQLQAAATQVAQSWNPSRLRGDEREAISTAIARGEHWLARLLERQARGRFVESHLRRQFRTLKGSRVGVDVVDPATGYRYEILSGTDSNLALHGQRMADVFFRMISF